jgi:predicted CopG family antitoxin
MVKCIKLQEPIYDRVTTLMAPKESYSDTIKRLLDMYEKLGDLCTVLENPAVYSYLEAFRTKAEKSPN